MKALFSFIVLLFSFQVPAQVLIEYETTKDMDQFDWLEFINEENIQKHIDFRSRRLNRFGAKINTITGLKWNKLDLIQIEQELGLYKMGEKTGLSPEMIKAAEEAIGLHWENIISIEDQIRVQAGLAGDLVEAMPMNPMVGDIKDYRDGVWELYKGDHEILFNMVEKKDEALYKALGSDDEAYAGFIAPYVQRYMEKVGETAGAYYDSFKSTGVDVNSRADDELRLLNMYLDSAEIYKCFIKNFEGLEGENQQVLMSSILEWQTHQGLLGVNSTIEAYKNYGINADRPDAIAHSLFDYYYAPIEVKEKIGEFLRNDMLYNEEFIKADIDDIRKLGARVDALIGLNYLGVATPEEQELYNKAIEEGIIRYNSTHSFFGRALPLPE